MVPPQLQRARVLALNACVSVGGRPTVAQMERAGLVTRADTLAVPASLLASYCARVGKPIPARFVKRGSRVG
jgi:hypothetical protein